jgi:predicted glycosyltransferase
VNRRFVFYSHDGVGLGHLRRNLAVAAALTEAEPNASVLLASGCDELGAHGLAPNVDVLVLPGLRKVGNGRYSARRLPMPGREVRALRSAQLEAAIRSFRPDVVLVDKHPVGVRGELRPALEALRERGGRVVLGLRDILDDAASVAEEWSATGVIEEMEHYVDRVLIGWQKSHPDSHVRMSYDESDRPGRRCDTGCVKREVTPRRSRTGAFMVSGLVARRWYSSSVPVQWSSSLRSQFVPPALYMLRIFM